MAELGLSRLEDVDGNGNVQVAHVVCSVLCVVGVLL